MLLYSPAIMYADIELPCITIFCINDEELKSLSTMEIYKCFLDDLLCFTIWNYFFPTPHYVSKGDFTYEYFINNPNHLKLFDMEEIKESSVFTEEEYNGLLFLLKYGE